jgi:hypothetical protein
MFRTAGPMITNHEQRREDAEDQREEPLHGAFWACSLCQLPAPHSHLVRLETQDPPGRDTERVALGLIFGTFFTLSGLGSTFPHTTATNTGGGFSATPAHQALAPKLPPGSYSDGTYVVGSNTQPGRYVTAGPPKTRSCLAAIGPSERP